MTTEQGQIVGDLEVTSRMEVHGQMTGHVTVCREGVLFLKGQATKSVTVNEGGRAIISGMVSGDVINNGGNILITGMVVGKVIEFAGETGMSHNASIGEAV